MNIDREKLKALAESATPGPWVKSAPGEVSSADYEVDGEIMCDHIASGFGCGSSDPDDAAFVAAANPETILAMLAEIERLEREAKNDLIAYKAVLERQHEIRDERDQLKAENEALRSTNLWWVTDPGNGLVRCVPDERYRGFSPSIRARYSPVAVKEDEALGKDAERYRFIRGYYTKVSVEIAIPGFESDWVTGDQADKEIDAAMSKEAI